MADVVEVDLLPHTNRTIYLNCAHCQGYVRTKFETEIKKKHMMMCPCGQRLCVCISKWRNYAVKCRVMQHKTEEQITRDVRMVESLKWNV